MTLAWPKMTYTRFGSKALRAPSSPDLNPLEKNFRCSFKSPTCKCYHRKITSIKTCIAKTQRTPILGFQIKMWLPLSLAGIMLLVLRSKILNPKQENIIVSISYFIRNLQKCSFQWFWLSWKICQFFLILAAAPCICKVMCRYCMIYLQQLTS